MQERQLRLGDILDDYCPRERRVTNHVVVAMIESDVKQTRCTTCDADHEYKHAKVPRQRRKTGHRFNHRETYPHGRMGLVAAPPDLPDLPDPSHDGTILGRSARRPSSSCD